MDGVHFDHWTRRLAGGAPSRRGMLRLALGGSLAVVVSATAPDGALACRRDGRACVKGKRNGDCCSGTCRNGKCRRTPGAGGCTVNMDFCQNTLVACPRREGFCVVLDSGKPLCIEAASCSPCTSDESCTTGGVTGKCVTTCPVCAGTDTNACVYTQPVG